MPPRADVKTPKGTHDFGIAEMRLREKVFNTIKHIFHRHGAGTIDTPVFELRDVLMGKYGEEQKLVYDLADQGGELCCLRYDLTVPFARFIATNCGNNTNIKRYHIGKVYRRDQPGDGRFREFYQCDFDISGTYAPMVADSEVVSVMAEVLSALEVGDFQISLNHRGLLDGMFKVAGIPEEMFKTVCSSIDKLDKLKWDDVRAELVNVKGIEEEKVDCLHQFVEMKSTDYNQLLNDIKQSPLAEHAESAIRDLELLFEIFDLLPGVSENIFFDLSLARGLDYYTGIVVEAKLLDEKGKYSGGSIAGGGRYDHLLGSFFRNPRIIPAVGMSIGIERIFDLKKELYKKSRLEDKTPLVSVYVGSPQASQGRQYLLERIKIATLLWQNDISAVYSPKEKHRWDDQTKFFKTNHIPLVILIGEDELSRGCVAVKTIAAEVQEDVLVEDLVEYVFSKLNDDVQ
ncbi:hypothetical protein GEMRC1_009850 [Eukaryota sp. GEM-RC1]